MPGSELIGQEEVKAINDVFEKKPGKKFSLYRYGVPQDQSRVTAFETAIAQKVGARYAHCVCNGTAALKLALFGLGVKPGDEVITQSFTFIATLEAILELGAKPVITEIDDSLNMDPLDLEKKVTDKTKAIIPVHMGGVASSMDEIMAIAARNNIPIVEDSAQALGATYHGKCLGTLGDAGIYSLDTGKIITTGEGGILVTNREDIYVKARAYSDHGHEQNPDFPRGRDTRSFWGFNYKMTEIQGALGLAQLEKLDYMLGRQRENKKLIKQGLNGIKGISFRSLPDYTGDASDTLIFFLETRERAEALADVLTKQGIGTKNLPDALDWHFSATWTHIFYDYPEYKDKDLTTIWPKSTDLLRRAIAVPIMVNMDKARIEKVISVLKEALDDRTSNLFTGSRA